MVNGLAHAQSLQVLTPLGVEVAPLSTAEVATAILDAIDLRGKTLISNHNLHSAYLAACEHSGPTYDSVAELATLTFADGLPLAIAAWVKSARGSERRPWFRVGALDWLPLVAPELARQHARVFYLGGSAANLDRATKRLREEYPGLILRGHHGFLRDAHLDALLAEIYEFQPDLLLVGMGMPLQEQFIIDNWEDLPVATIMDVGALFDYFGGAQKAPPRRLGPLGVEWLYRLVRDPRRLWRRYLLEPLLLGGILLRRKAVRGTRR